MLSVAAPVPAATPRDEALRLVPEDVGFCLLIQDLREHSAALQASPFLRQVKGSEFGKRLLAAPEIQKLALVEQVMAQQLGIGWAELRDDFLGDAVVLAYRPGPPGKPEREQGLLVLRARSEKRLVKFLDRLNEIQLKSGDVTKLEEKRHGGKLYFHRVEKKGENYYYVRGPVLAFSTKEEILRQAIDRDADATSETEPAVAHELERLGGGQGLATLWINPRAFEPELRAKAERAQGGEAAFLRTLLVYWKALDGVILTADVGRQDVAMRLVVNLKPGLALPGGRQLFAGTPPPSRLWARFPDDALLAMAGQVDARALTGFVGDFLDDEARKGIRETADRGVGAAFGRDLANDVLPAIGPDWGFCVLAPAAEEKAWFPHVIWALQIQPGKGKPPLDKAFLSALNSLALIVVYAHNQEHPGAPMALREATGPDNVEVKYLENEKLFPPGLRPAFALKDGYLLLASSPEAIGRFGPPIAATSVKGEVPLVRLSLREWRRYLTDRREPLAAHIAASKQISSDEAVKRLNGLIEVLEFFDRLDVAERVARPGQLTLTVRLRTATPLKK